MSAIQGRFIVSKCAGPGCTAQQVLGPFTRAVVTDQEFMRANPVNVAKSWVRTRDGDTWCPSCKGAWRDGKAGDVAAWRAGT